MVKKLKMQSHHDIPYVSQDNISNTEVTLRCNSSYRKNVTTYNNNVHNIQHGDTITFKADAQQVYTGPRDCSDTHISTNH